MEYYLKVLKEHYADFNGRSRRKEFWMFILFSFLFSLAAGIVDNLLGITIISAIYGLAVLIPTIAAGIRRLHDTGKSGWWILIALIPLIGTIWLIVLLAMEGDHGSNEYGPDPKGA